jgi:hypothetical protein
MHRLPTPPKSSPETRSADERAYRNEEQRKQWHERLQLILIGWPTLIFFSGTFDQVLLPLLHGTAPTPLFQIPSMIALISSIPVCFALYHFYQRENRAFHRRASITDASRAATASVFGMAILNLITHFSQSMHDIVIAIGVTIVVTLCIVMGFLLFYFLFHPPRDTQDNTS